MTARSGRLLLGFVSATAALVIAMASDRPAQGDEAEELDAFIARGMQDWSLTGLAVGVVKDDKVVFIRGYGVSDIRTQAAVDEHTVFQIGSCSKPLTASGLALLVQDGGIDWGTPLREKWADFRVADPIVGQQATLRDVLCHRTGVGKDESVLYFGMPITRAELLRRLPEVEQAAPFRTQWCYSNLMYSVAGRVAEQITGDPWDEYLSQRLFVPLEMSRTSTSMESLPQAKNVAVPHVRVGEQTFPTAFADQDNIGPAASISSSASDLSHWLMMMVNHGRYKGRQILEPELVAEMLRPHALMPFADPVHGAHNVNTYGLGLMICDYHGRRLAKHAGMAGHSLAMLGLVPEDRVGVVVLTNHRPCLFHYAVFRRAVDLYCGMPAVDLDAANEALLAEHLARQEKSLKCRADARDPTRKPTLALDEYAGTYERDYGLRAEIKREGEQLVLRYGNFAADVVPWHDDTFRARLRERRLAAEQDWYLTFTIDEAEVAKLHIESEHDVCADFVRIAEASDQPAGRAAQPPAPGGALRRRALFGAQLAPVTHEVRERHKLDEDGGVLLEHVFPGTSAAEAEFKAGDVVLALGGSRVADTAAFLERIASMRAGDTLTCEMVRDGVKTEKQVTLKEMPGEKGEGYEVLYGAVMVRNAQLRTLVTRPKGDGRHPAVMLLQGGHTCFSLDNPVGRPTAITWIAHDLARHGYVTMRVERPGCGDSEGGPLRDVDFDTELEGNLQALHALKQMSFVDADNVFLFGHSMGGIMAPLMANEVPVRGIVAYGTASATWFESVFGQRRRLASLDGTEPAEADREMLRQARFWYPLLIEKKTPLEILEQDPELQKLGWVTDDKYVGDRLYTFHHQLAGKNLAEAWANVARARISVGGKVASPRVLALWGASDWLSTRETNAWIAEVVNRENPGSGSLIVLDSIDHFFLRAASPEESYRLWKPVKGAPPGEFSPVIVETLCRWLDETAGRE